MADIQTVLTHSAPLWNLPAHNARCLEAMLYLEMASIKYQRRISKYNVNYFVSELELPVLRHNCETTRTVIEFCEGIGNEKTHIVGKNHGINCHLQFRQQADVSALQSLIKDRLHLVYLHQLYANQANWTEYCGAMRHYLPFVLRRFLLNKEREYALKRLTRNNIITAKQAKELLIDCLHVIFMKMSDGKNNINHIIEINKNDPSARVQYFFGAHSQPTSLDACLVSEIVLLECCQLPHKYLNDIKDDPKIQHLLKYSKRIMDHYHESIISKLTPQNEIAPIDILKRPKQFNKTNESDPTFYNKLIDTQEKQNSVIFLVGSVTAFVLYWRFFQPH